VSTSIADQIFAAIRSGSLQPGVALPSERELAQQFGVSRGSVREAIRALEHGGALEVRSGSGTYVTADAASKMSTVRVHAAIVGDQSPFDIVTVRQSLEPSVAEHAAANRTAADLAFLTDNLQQHHALIRTHAPTLEVDSAFHLALARATHNPVFVTLIEHIVTSLGQNTWLHLKGVTHDIAGNSELFYAHHQAIFAAVEAYDADGAYSAMQRHLRTIEQALARASTLADRDAVADANDSHSVAVPSSRK
jgi:GntR family transcriptional repressor for pyruvate dehydrogenase complex